MIKIPCRKMDFDTSLRHRHVRTCGVLTRHKFRCSTIKIEQVIVSQHYLLTSLFVYSIILNMVHTLTLGYVRLDQNFLNKSELI